MHGTLEELETPTAIVDLDRMERNLDRAATYAAEHGLALRPHIKTHKSPRIAAEQMRRGAVGLTCATPREAEVMTEVSEDILLAYPPVGAARARRVVSVSDRTRVTVALDSDVAIEHLAAAARPVGRAVAVYIELDLGMHRVGVPSVEQAITLAKLVRRTPPLEYAGIAFYPGHVREPVGEQDAKLRDIDTGLRDAVAAMARAGVRPTAVSGGSTPTLWRSHELQEVTEIRPGTYVYNDRTTAEVGACAWDDCALTVLSRVVGRPAPDRLILDAGSKTLSSDGARGFTPLPGFGAILEDPGSDRVDESLLVERLSEEHATVRVLTGSTPLEPGDRVRIVPNHSCVVSNLVDQAWMVDGTSAEPMPIAARGRIS
jgi:D-serine deaminase-like pyridoxal phosphate-dependent protein